MGQLMKLNRVPYLLFAGIIPIGTFSPKALVLLLFLTAGCLLSLNDVSVGRTLKRAGQYFIYFLPLLLVGLSSSLWSLESSLSAKLALKLTLLVATGCVAIAAVAQLSSATIGVLRQAIHLGVFLAASLLLFEVATSSWLYRMVRGFSWEQVIFEPTGGINLNAPIKSGITVISIFVWCLFVNTRRGVVAAVAAFILILVLAWAFGANATLVALPLGLVAALAARLALRPVLIFIAITFCLVAMLSPFVTQMVLKDVTPSTISSQVGAGPLPISGMNRLITWKFTSQKIMEKPVLGWGLRTSRALPGGGKKYDITKTPENGRQHLIIRDFFIPLHPHNQFLQIWLELGALGALLFAATGGLLIIRIVKSEKEIRHSQWVVGAVVTLIIYNQISFGVWQNWWIAGQFMTIGLMLITLFSDRPIGQNERSSV